ncbi:MAG: hypothetical protein AW10_03351 [Candidatus Accumulibacter appositus]|uniref:Uncharacterized protein n=1 Tax=Candidatus Accumulibacter appositus TaxID=1454003 RepID=A0A011N654_9PROT|nr:MAG: hypothetical protein AW10_03351 [Candidatus Accumulibacter appositus]
MTFAIRARGSMAASSAEHARAECTMATRAAGTPRFRAVRGMSVSRPEDAGATPEAAVAAAAAAGPSARS